jgi:alpha-glucoside transport system permease protein
MSQTTGTAAAAIPVDKGERRRQTRRQPGRGEGNPARAGWFTKITLTILVILWVVPVLGTLITSFRTLDAANSSGWWQVFYKPSTWGSFTFDNYHEAIFGEAADMGNAFINSFAITLPATFIPLLVAAFAAYAFTFMEFPGRDVLFLTVVSLLVVPNYVALVPMLKIYGSLGMSGTFPAVWLAHIGFGMSLAIFILRNYMATLPKTVIESAKIDGATHFQTFFRLVLPMSAPAIAAFAIFQFLWVWNDLLVALVFIGPGDNEPVTMALTHLKGQLGQGWNLTTAGGFFTMIVPIIVFLALQRYFVRGLTAGAVKG